MNRTLQRLADPARAAAPALAIGPQRHTHHRDRRLVLVLILSALVGTPSSQAILFHATGDPSHNTTAPTGPLEGSGWQWLGTWIGFIGTPVHPKFFLTAAHVQGRIGDSFRFRGETYVTRSSVVVPGTDLRLWGICGSFPDYAPLHTNRSLEGRSLVWFGRGTERGTEVTLTNQGLAELRGWRWGADTRVIRWGENRVEDSREATGVGRLLRARFDPDGGPNECHLSTGDSGGPAFVFENDRWELAGIHYAVDGPYSYEAVGPGFNAALFDHQGFYWRDNSDWVPTVELESPKPGGLYTIEVAAYAEWILDYLSKPIPPDDSPFLESAPTVTGPFGDVPDAVVDWENRTISSAVPGVPTFFRLRGCQPSRLTGAEIDDDRLIFGYE